MNNNFDYDYLSGMLNEISKLVNQQQTLIKKQSSLIENQQTMIDKQSELIELIHKESINSEQSSKKSFMISCISLAVAITFGLIQTIVLFI